MMFHNGYPKFWQHSEREPSWAAISGTCFWPVRRRAKWSGSSPTSPHMTNTCVRVLLPDHTFTRLNTLRDDIKTVRR